MRIFPITSSGGGWLTEGQPRNFSGSDRQLWDDEIGTVDVADGSVADSGPRAAIGPQADRRQRPLCDSAAQLRSIGQGSHWIAHIVVAGHRPRHGNSSGVSGEQSRSYRLSDNGDGRAVAY